MKLRDVLDNDRLLLVACNDCHAKTPLDPSYFALRHGAQADVAALEHDLLCPSCGSGDIALRAFSPVEQRELAVAPPTEVRA